MKKVIFYNLRMFFGQSNIQNERLSILNRKGLGLLWIINFLRTKIFADICYSNLDYVAAED